MNVVIIGCGFAGAACAWWLTRLHQGFGGQARLGVKDVTILEREEMPGLHASGLNAGMARRFEEDKVVAPLAEEGIEFIHNPPEGFVERPLIECNGSLLLFSKEAGSSKLEAGFSSLQSLASSIISKPEAIQKIPLLSDAKFTHAIWTPTDGVVDINSYLWAFINGAKAGGAKFITNCEIKKFNVIARTSSLSRRTKSRHAAGLAMTTNQGIFKADVIVNAAGAWAPEVGALAGAEKLDIKSYRRHLYCTPPMPEIDPKWPFVWDIKNQYYFRPESGGLLLGPGDEEEAPAGVPPINPKIKEMLAEKLAKYCPSLANVSIAREWCGLRTFTPDRRPLIRWDKRMKNFFWLTALGGRGVTCAASAGRIAAEMIIKNLNLL